MGIGARQEAASGARGLRVPERELVPLGQNSSFRTHVHDYPHPLARWHHHPEIEIHLTTASSGTAHIGGAVRGFQPGSFFLVGGGVPHNWVSSLAAGETVPGRDVLAHLDPGMFGALAGTVPELGPVSRLLGDARFGLEYVGSTREEAEILLRKAHSSTGLKAFRAILELLLLLAEAPAQDRIVIDPEHSAKSLPPEEALVFDRALMFLHENLSRKVGLDDLARHLTMSESQVSRLFTRATARGFSRTLASLRVTEACRLLRETDRSIGQICWDVGFGNLSNFNRRFKEETGGTPREFRRSLEG